MSRRLDGRFALVAGAGGGLGGAIARLFAREGAVVGVNDVDADAAEAVAAACRAESPDSRAVPFDVSDPGAVRAAAFAGSPTSPDPGARPAVITVRGRGAVQDTFQRPWRQPHGDYDTP